MSTHKLTQGLKSQNFYRSLRRVPDGDVDHPEDKDRNEPGRVEVGEQERHGRDPEEGAGGEEREVIEDQDESLHELPSRRDVL